MKANELMVGNFVYVPHGGKATHYGKVTALLSSGSVECELNKSRILASSVEPIPLTPEILEKNGFYYGFTPNEEDFCSATGAGYPGSGWCYGEGAGEVKIIFPIGSDGGFIRLDDENFDRALELVFTHHIWVHDLQHALRLCGIDKEIVL